MKLGKDQVKFVYDPAKIVKLRFRSNELILDESLIVISKSFLNLTQSLIIEND